MSAVASYAIWVVGCGLQNRLIVRPKVSLNCSLQQDGSLVFELQEERMGAIDQVAIWSETTGEPLWGFAVAPRPVEPANLRTFMYGKAPQVPDLPVVRRVKTYPPKNKPRPIAPMERFIVEVFYQYDTFGGPAVGRTCFYFDAPRDSPAKITGRMGGSKVMPAAFLEAFK
jgi:hypothetical protein